MFLKIYLIALSEIEHFYHFLRDEYVVEYDRFYF